MEECTLQQQCKNLCNLLPEHHRRLYAGTLASALPHGGITRISRDLFISRKTVSKGMRESAMLGSSTAVHPTTNIRKPGGGRKDLLMLNPTIGKTFDAVVASCTAGDPMNEAVKWVSMTRKGISTAMEALLGYPMSEYYVSRLLKAKGFSRRKMSKSIPLKQVEDKDAQFKNIERLRKEYNDSKSPVVSIDTKKKEMLGNFYREGRCFCKESRKVSDHDFPSFSNGKVTPHGVYDIQRNEGFLTCGTTAHDTFEFNVTCIGDWWDTLGKSNYPSATKLLILADGGGSNSSRSYKFRQELQELSDRIGREIRIAHYPPYSSKWNPIEHLLFCHISRGWNGMVFNDASEMVLAAMRVTTTTGLKVYASLKTQQYEKGIKASESFLQDYSVVHDEYLGKWNYVIKPREESP
ncbi:MAG: ISAzo13 family transposase [Sphaerochaeta sp.]|nr:ISAzo13 family transposase [Sphaerochaeta sp.]